MYFTFVQTVFFISALNAEENKCILTTSLANCLLLLRSTFLDNIMYFSRLMIIFGSIVIYLLFTIEAFLCWRYSQNTCHRFLLDLILDE